MATDPDAALHRAKPGLYKPRSAASLAPARGGTLADTVEQLPNLSAPRIGSAPIEDPATLGDVFHASIALARQDSSDFQTQVLREGYAPILEAIGEQTVFGRSAYMGRSFNQYMLNPGDLSDEPQPTGYPVPSRGDMEAAIVREIRARRATDPKFLPGVPDTLDGLHAMFRDQQIAKRHGAQATLERSPGGISGTLASLGGGMAGAMQDPVNLWTLPIGGGGKTIGQTMFREALINGAIELAEQPLVAQNRDYLGEHLTIGEAGANTLTTAAGAGILTGAIHGTVKGIGYVGDKSGATAALQRSTATIGAVLNAMPDRAKAYWGPKIRNGKQAAAEFLSALTNRELARFSRDAHGGKLTPDEQAAATMLERNQEIGETSPYEPGPVGDGIHEAELGAAIEAVKRGLPVEDQVAEAGRPAFAEARPPEGLSTARRPQSNRAGPPHFSNAIYEGLKARGIPDHVARGAAAGSFAEAAAGAGALNPASGAMGIGQWLGSRKAGLIKRFGEHPNLDQQLDYLAGELKGGDAGGASVLSAKDEVEALDRYIRDFMRPAAGAETTGDLERGMAALGRGGEGLPAGGMAGPDYARSSDPEIARLRAEALQLGEAVIGIGRKPDGAAVNVYASRVPASRIGIDAERFQFKSGGDQYGVTDRLRGVEEIDPLALGRLTLWEARDGRLFVADGHQRTGLVKRIDAAAGGDTMLDVGILREADGVSAEDARVMAALKNIGEDSGTAIDAAKIGRANAEALERAARRLPPKSPLVRDGRALAKLSDDAFGAVYNGLVPPDFAAVIGHLLPDRPELHAGIVDLLVKLDPANRGQAESIVRQAIAAGFEKAEQVELFGLRELNSSLFLERSKVLEKGLAQLRKLRLVHKTAAESADTLEAAGSRIARGASAKEAKANAEAVEIVSRLAFSKGPIADALNDGARSLANGGNLGNLARAFADRVRTLDLGELARLGSREAGSDASSRLVPDGAGRGGDAGDAGAAVRGVEEQPSLLELQAATERFSDPAGPAVQQQAESLVHDLKAELEGPTQREVDRLVADVADLGVQLDLTYPRGAKHITLDMITRTTGEKGAGAEAIGYLTEFADEHGLKVELSAVNTDLIPYYERLGFHADQAFEPGDLEVAMSREPSGVLHGEASAMRPLEPTPDRSGAAASKVASEHYKDSRSLSRLHDAFVGGAAVARGERTEPFHPLRNAAEKEAFADGGVWASRVPANLDALGRRPGFRRIGENEKGEGVFENGEGERYALVDRNGAPFPNYGGMLVTVAAEPPPAELKLGDRVTTMFEGGAVEGVIAPEPLFGTAPGTEARMMVKWGSVYLPITKDTRAAGEAVDHPGRDAYVAAERENQQTYEADLVAAHKAFEKSNPGQDPFGFAPGFRDALSAARARYNTRSLANRARLLPEGERLLPEGVKFRLDEEGDEISAEDLLAELEADEKAIKDIEDCL